MELFNKMPAVELEAEPNIKCCKCHQSGYIYLKNHQLSPLCDVCADPIDVNLQAAEKHLSQLDFTADDCTGLVKHTAKKALEVLRIISSYPQIQHKTCAELLTNIKRIGVNPDATKLTLLDILFAVAP